METIEKSSELDVPLEIETNSRLVGPVAHVVFALGAVALSLCINQVFRLRILGIDPVGNSFLYLLIGLFLAITFLIKPATAKFSDNVPTFDWLLSALAIGGGGYFAWHGLDIIQQGWDYDAPLAATILAGVFLLLILECLRRCAGWTLVLIAVVFGSYPIYADYMPAFLWGTRYSFAETIRAHVMGAESVIGIPMRVVGDLVVGFVVFGVTLIVTGGGRFFMEVAIALLGGRRGGPAKVAVISSGLMGSLSGSVVTNILTTGPITIRMMKKSGYPRQYAAAVEACASTGGTLMPPVMGAVAFVMASFLAVPYATIVVAAFFPALLFYLALIFQVDLYAAKHGIQGLPKDKLPKLSAVLKTGWPYLLSLSVLVYMLLVQQIESRAPYLASLVLIFTSAFNPRYRLNFERVTNLILEFSASTAYLVSILAGIGLVVGGLSYSGVAGAFARELLIYANGNVALLLLAGAVTSFILGMGMTVSACYIFLSILLAPALVAAGLHPVASHLFILYWGMMSFITPPVALASLTASNLADADTWKTSLNSMRLGAPLLILPFLFVLNPALILEGELLEVALAASTAILAMIVFSGALEGHLYVVGRLSVFYRLAYGAVGMLFVVPGVTTDTVGFALLVGITAIHRLRTPRSRTVASN